MKRLLLALLLWCVSWSNLWAAFTEFYCNADAAGSSSSNLNGGSGTGAATATDSAATYERDTGAGALDRIVASSGTPFSGVSVNEFVGVVAAGGSAPATFICRVTAINGGGTSIDVSDAAAGGTRPAHAASVDVKVGGAWQGPNGAVGFPMTMDIDACTNTSGDPVRVNFKNNATYSPTAAITIATQVGMTYEGYSSTVGDGGRALFSGSTGVAGYTAFSAAGGTPTLNSLIFENNGNSGANVLVSLGTVNLRAFRCVFRNSRGHGLTTGNGIVQECEFYGCNQSGSVGVGGLLMNSGKAFACISHHNTATNSVGFALPVNADNTFVHCIAAENASHGFFVQSARNYHQTLINCDSYLNGGDGFRISQNLAPCFANLINCNFIDNGGYGVNVDSGTLSSGTKAWLFNCGFGSGNRVNTSGTYPSNGMVISTGEVTYASDVVPWADPDNGDFSINLAAAKNAGRCLLTSVNSSEYSTALTTGYPDIGAAQHQDSGGGSGSSPFSIGIGN